MLPTLVRRGKLSPVSTVRPWRVKAPPILVREFPLRVVRPETPGALKSPVIDLIPSNATAPTTPVAIARDPVYVAQEARAVASPPF